MGFTWGGVDDEANKEALDERIIQKELAREVMEEVGLRVLINPMPIMFPAILKGGGDWAFIVPTLAEKNISEDRESFEIKWLDPAGLSKIVNQEVGNRLVSGWGKRMHRLCLKAIESFSPNEKYRKEAREILLGIQRSW